ncbi:MAG: BLUF domain-containing protein [Deltaproteobacteria bacterium]|nr:MAG: BLUF domain-containing protein [Deltaproteobacteria bacterium]
MQRVMYVSRAKRKMSKGELSDLLMGARARNEAHGITGALIYDAGYFGQILEGPEAAIQQLLLNIAADPRHEEYELVSSGPVEERYFDGWSMDWIDLGTFADTKHAELRGFLRQHPVTDRGAVFRALTTFIADRAKRRDAAHAEGRR